MNNEKHVCKDDGCKCHEIESPKAKQGPKARPVTKSLGIGRNQPCPCGSGKKYKKCCLK
jgi:preprotein translocase subunit SecA